VNRRVARGLAVAGAALLIIIAAGSSITIGRTRELPARALADRPALMLLTSLPIMFPETFGLDRHGSPTLAALQRRYRVLAIPVADAVNLKGGRLLLMAQPRAQPAEVLVELDSWVRAGGHAVLLADPLLEWSSERPAGDALRPSPMFADTGLLAHWGLRLDAPDERGLAERTIGGAVLTVSPGTLFGRCAIDAGRIVARCAIGRGRVTVIADADFIDERQVGDKEGSNLDALLGELARLE